MDEVRRFARLFRGRKDAYGADGGGCVTADPEMEWKYPPPLLLSHFERHLSGEHLIGIYPLLDDLTVGWGCSDIDVEDRQQAMNLYDALRALGMWPWLEASRSKGYHVWVLPEDWCPAQSMRDALLAAHQIADVPAKEVNPKQTSLEGLKGFGNYVRLPYPERGKRGRQVMIDRFSGEIISFTHFLDLAEFNPSRLHAIEAAAELYAPPPPKRAVQLDGSYDGALEPLVKRLSGLAFTIFRDGPLDGSDRSSTLAKLAHKCRESELNASEALAIVTDLDRRLGKFYGRPDAEQRLVEIIESAY